MDVFSHFLQSNNTQVGATQITTEQKKFAQEDCASPYFSNSMSVLPADEYGYYVIYHRGASGESRDDNEHDTFNHSPVRNDAAREDDGMVYSSKQNHTFLSANNSMAGTTTQSKFKSCAYHNTSSRSQQSSPAVSELSEEDDSDDSEAGFVSYTAEACVACSIPVLHFLQFFMC